MKKKIRGLSRTQMGWKLRPRGFHHFRLSKKRELLRPFASEAQKQNAWGSLNLVVAEFMIFVNALKTMKAANEAPFCCVFFFLFLGSYGTYGILLGVPGFWKMLGFGGCEFWSDLEWSGYQRSLELPPAWNISTNGRMLNAGKSNSFGVKKGGEVGEFWKSSQVPVTVTFSFRFFWKNKQLQKSFSLVTFNCSHLVSRWGAGGVS